MEHPGARRASCPEHVPASTCFCARRWSGWRGRQRTRVRLVSSAQAKLHPFRQSGRGGWKVQRRRLLDHDLRDQAGQRPGPCLPQASSDRGSRCGPLDFQVDAASSDRGVRCSGWRSVALGRDHRTSGHGPARVFIGAKARLGIGDSSDQGFLRRSVARLVSDCIAREMELFARHAIAIVAASCSLRDCEELDDQSTGAEATGEFGGSERWKRWQLGRRSWRIFALAGDQSIYARCQPLSSD
ncbi:hypothetical protein L1887_57906 [Cichorium endivia]|nr:hypothetical protein L1887_57906 [Cichorium endivia]